MHVVDSVYGKFEITEPLLVELIQSKTVQRLKRIAQHGIPAKYHHLRGFSRYDHCLGVMLLLRKLGASVEEQAAGLLHDVSHTAFSHVIDEVLGSPEEQNYQDSIHSKFVVNSDAAIVLKKFGLDPLKVAHLESYSLLEQPSPELCADRIDYSLREFAEWAAPDAVNPCVETLTAVDGKIVFTNQQNATQFARAFLKCSLENWSAPDYILQYQFLGKALKLALDAGIISIDDLFVDDEHVLTKLERSNSSEVKDALDALSRKIKWKEVSTGGILLKSKFRYVDPLFFNEKRQLIRLSECDSEYAALISEKKKQIQPGFRVELL